MVDVEYKNTLAEVAEILKYTEEELVNLIPKNVINFIEENKSNEYVSTLEPNVPLNEQKISEEAKALIALLYRSYIATPEEKEQFEQKDKIEFEELEKEKSEKYNVDVFMARRKNDEKQNDEEKAVTDVVAWKKETWYMKIWKKIMKLFKKS